MMFSMEQMVFAMILSTDLKHAHSCIGQTEQANFELFHVN